MKTAVTSVADFRFPSLPIARILKEACAAWNLRHTCEEWLDPETSPWDQKFLAATLAWLRHSFPDMTRCWLTVLTVKPSAGRFTPPLGGHYPWLSLDSDPRTRFRTSGSASESTQSTQSTRRLDIINRGMGKALSAKQEALARADRAQAREFDRYIADGLATCQRLRALVAPDFVDDALQNGICIPRVRRDSGEGRYVFEGRELPENLTVYLPVKCQCCLARIRRTKRELDLGGGVRLYAVSCLCTSTLLPRSLCHVPQELWDSLTTEKDATP